MTDIINNMIKGLVDFTNHTVGAVPDLCPFKTSIENVVSSFDSEMLGYVNYFLPISEFVAILSVWVAAIVAYYGVSIILRWVKAVS